MDQICVFSGSKRQPVKNLPGLTHTIAKRIGRFLLCHGLLEGYTENCYLSSSVVKDEQDPMHQLHGASVTVRAFLF